MSAYNEAYSRNAQFDIYYNIWIYATDLLGDILYLFIGIVIVKRQCSGNASVV